MPRSYLLSLLLLFILCEALPQASGNSPASVKKPNVLFLAVDDMNDWIGCMESKTKARTPNFDRLASRGICFTNAHTAGVFCAPSRSAIFTGQFASTTGCYRTANYFKTHPEIDPLQVTFSRSGYKTLGAGKLFHHPVGAIDPRGWDKFFLRTQTQRQNGWALDSWGKGTPFPSPFPNSIYNRGGQITGGLFLEWGAIPDSREEEMADTQRINWAVEQLNQKHDEPFFLGVGIYAPHFPNYCPKKYFDLYNPTEIQLPEYKANDLDDLPPKIRKIKTARSRIHHRLQDLDAVDDAIHGYLACISYADAMMGRVLDALDSSPYSENTIVVLWSDHGYHHGEKGDWGKHTLWERTSNVPFIWAGPGIAKGSKTDVTVSLIDMYPTLVEMCGLRTPKQKLEGKSLAATLASPHSASDRNVFLPHMNPGEYAIINRDWRYISYDKDGDELYSLRDDPNEWSNLAGEPKHAALITEMRQSAPRVFAAPEPSLNARKDLVIQGDTFHWEKGDGNYTPPQKYLPYTNLPQAPVQKRIAPKSEDAIGSTGRNLTKNVLLIICDDLNTHVKPSGYENIVTPAMDAFASKSMTFDRAFCQYPVCGPSRASMLSGLYPESTGILNNTDDIRNERRNTITMPQFFRENGFWTGSVGKVFHSPRHEHGDKAWDEFYRFENDELEVVKTARLEFESVHGSVELAQNRRKWRDLKKQVSASLNAQTPPGYGESGLTDEQHKDGKNARQVAQWLTEKTHGSKPFFIACGIQKPHVPFLAPAKYFDLYPLKSLTYERDRPDLWDSIPRLALSKRYEAFGFKMGIEDDQLRREYMQAYHACVSFIDAQIKIVLEAVKESGHWDDTTIILTSDHGYHLGDHFLWGKVTLFDIGAKVPFIIRAPGLTTEGAHSQAMVELIDIFPTLTQLTGLNAPAQLQGNSLRPLLAHPDRLGKKKFSYSVVTRGEKMGFALRNQRWRYGKWPDGEELYNLVNDPAEKKNLIKFPHVQSKLEEFRALLQETQKRASEKRDQVREQ
jgi:arylsulfatase A-like enzyme